VALEKHQSKSGHLPGCECEDCGKVFSKDQDLERHCVHTGHMSLEAYAADMPRNNEPKFTPPDKKEKESSVKKSSAAQAKISAMTADDLTEVQKLNN
jgi:hypothetical protein